MTALAADPFDELIAYAGTDDGLYRTTDGGVSWSRQGPSSVHRSFRWLGADLLVRNRLFAVVEWGHSVLLRSDDGGSTWLELEVPFSGPVQGRAVLAGTPTTIYTALGGASFARSRDGGVSWRVHEWPTSAPGDFVASRSDDRVLYVSGSGHVWRSGDEGQSWVACGDANGLERLAYHLAVDPNDSARVFSPNRFGLLVSEDGCASWELRVAGALQLARRVVVDVESGDRLYAATVGGGLISTNGGITWEDFGPSLSTIGVPILAQSPASPDRLWLGRVSYEGSSGVFSTADRGDTWTLGERGMHAQPIPVLVTSGASEATIFAGRAMTTDGGSSWTQLFGPERPWFVAAASHADPARLWAGGEFDSLYRSDDGGATWEQHRPAQSGHWIRSVAADPVNPDTAYISLDAGESSGLYQSTDAGASWELVLADELGFPVGEITIHPTRPQEMWLGSQGGPLRSLDHGTTWTLQGDGLEVPDGTYPNPFDPGMREHWAIDGVAVDPENRDHVLAHSCGGLWASTDGGESWSPSRDGLTVCHEAEGLMPEPCWAFVAKTSRPLVCTGGPQSISFDPEDPSVVYAPTAFGPYRSLDGGRTWRPFTAGWGQYGTGNLIAVGGGRVLAGTSYSGVIAFDELGAGTPATPRDAAVD